LGFLVRSSDAAGGAAGAPLRWLCNRSGRSVRRQLVHACGTEGTACGTACGTAGGTGSDRFSRGDSVLAALFCSAV